MMNCPICRLTTTNSSLFSQTDLASHWNKSVRTLQRWNRAGSGPAYIRIGGTIFYRLNDILAFVETQRTCGVSQ